MNLCPARGTGQLTEHVELMPVTWEACSGSVPLRYSTCDTCLSEIVDDEQSRENKRAMLQFRAQS